MITPSTSGSPGTPPSTPVTKQPSSWLGRLGSGAWRTMRNTATFATDPIGSTARTFGAGLAQGALNTVKTQTETTLQVGPIADTLKKLDPQELKKIFEEALLKQPPKELFELQTLIKTILDLPTQITLEDLKKVENHLSLLLANEQKLLKQLAPERSPEDYQFFVQIHEWFHELNTLKSLDQFHEFQRDAGIKETLSLFSTEFSKLLELNQGACVKALSFVLSAFLDQEKGILKQINDTLKNTLIHDKTGLLQEFIDHFSTLIVQTDGPIDQMRKAALGDPRVDIALSRLLSEEGKEMKSNLIEPLLHLAWDQKKAPSSFPCTKQESEILLQVGHLLNTKLIGKEIALVNLVSLFSKEEIKLITSALQIAQKKHKEIFLNTLSSLQKELIAGSISIPNSNTVQPILTKLFSSDETAVQLQKYLSLPAKEKEILYQALQNRGKLFIQSKNEWIETTQKLLRELKNSPNVTPTHKKCFDSALLLLELKKFDKADVRRNLEHRCINNLIKDEPIRNALTTSVESLNEQKKILLKHILTNLSKLSPTEKKRLETQAKLIQAALNTTDPKMLWITSIEAATSEILTACGSSLLDYQTLLKQKKELTEIIRLLTSPEENKLALALETVEKQLIEEKSPFAYLESKLLHNADGIIVQMVDLLNERFNASNGPLDSFQKRIIDTFDQVCKTMNQQLNHEEKGVLSQVKKTLTSFTHDLDQQLTKEGDSLLTTIRSQTKNLQQAVIDQKAREIEKLSKEIEGLLPSLLLRKEAIFKTEHPLLTREEATLNELRAQLPSFYGSTPPTRNEMLKLIGAALDVLNTHFIHENGVVSRLKEELNPVLTRIENLPHTWKNSLLGIDSTDPSPTSSTGEVTVSNFLTAASKLLQQVFDTGKGAASSYALKGIASALLIGLEAAFNQMGNTDSFQGPKDILAQLIASLKQIQNGDPGTGWKALYQNMVQAADLLKKVHVYINNLRISSIPFFSSIAPVDATLKTPADAIYSENIEKLRTSIDTTPPPSEHQDWKLLAGEEKDKLIGNLANFLTLKHIYESVCNLKPLDEKLYLTLLMEANHSGAEDIGEELKRLFFLELERHNLSFFTRLNAQFQYYLFGKIVKKYTQKAVTLYFEEICSYIEKNKGNKFETLRETETKNLLRYLTILGRTYERVSLNPQPEGTIDEMLQKELQKEESNLGFNISDLYGDFAKQILKKATGSGISAWFIKKFFVKNPQELVRVVIDKTVGTLQDSGGYAMNCVISDQLKEIWTQLSKETTSSLASVEFTDSQKIQLSQLVENLFEILRKTQCRTLDELRNLVKGKLLSAKLDQTFEAVFIEKVIERVTMLIALAMQSLAEENQLYKLTYKFVNLANQSFEQGEGVTLEKRREAQRSIDQLSTQILRYSISAAVNEEFDFTGTRQQDETNQSITKLKTQSRQFIDSLRADLNSLTHMNFTSVEGKNKIQWIVEQTLKYETDCSRLNTSATSSNLNTDNRTQIEHRNVSIAEESKPLVQTVTELMDLSQTLQNLNVSIPHFKQIRVLMTSIPLRLFSATGATPEDIAFCENQMLLLDQELKELKKMYNLEAIIQQIKMQAQILASAINETKNSFSTLQFCREQTQPNCLIEELANMKKEQIRQPLHVLKNILEWKKKVDTLKQKITSSRIPDVKAAELKRDLEGIDKASQPEGVDHHLQTYKQHITETTHLANNTIQLAQQMYRDAMRTIDTTIEASHQLNPNAIQIKTDAIREKIVDAQAKLQTFDVWVTNELKLVPYVQRSAFDMKWLQDWSTGFVCNSVQKRLDGFVQFLKREDTFRYGLLNHLFLIPYNQFVSSTKKP